MAYLRAALALLALVALGVGYDQDVHTGDAVNFFFYFTDLSNVFGACVLLVGGLSGIGCCASGPACPTWYAAPPCCTW